MEITRAWDWSKNTDNHWLIPCVESAYLAEKWKAKGYRDFLDLGCGLGRHSIYMATHGFDVTAIDLSEYGVNYLKDWAKKCNLDIKTEVSNMLSLPFGDNSFDCIMAFNVIYHTDTQGFIKAINEIKRILRPGGELFLTLISKNTYSWQTIDSSKRIDENTILREEHDTERDVPHFYVDIEDIKRLFTDWSFENMPVECCEYNMNQPEYYSKHWTLMATLK